MTYVYIIHPVPVTVTLPETGKVSLKSFIFCSMAYHISLWNSQETFRQSLVSDLLPPSLLTFCICNENNASAEPEENAKKRGQDLRSMGTFSENQSFVKSATVRGLPIQ